MEDGLRGRPKILWLAVEPTPYLEDEFKALDRDLPFDFSFAFLTQGETQPWDARRGVVLSSVRGRHASVPGFLLFLLKAMWEPPTAVMLEGYGLAHFVLAAGVTSACGVPYLMRSDTPAWSAEKKRSVFRSAVLAWMVRHAAWLLPGGTRQMKAFLAAGASPARMSIGYMTVEGSRYARPEERREGERGRLRLVSVGRLVARKRMNAVVDAVRRARPRGLVAEVEIVGDGPEREALARAADGLEEAVRLSGFQDPAGVARALWRADAFILLAADEPWGLVVNEALAAGLPVVLDREIGCTDDLLRDGVNGFSVDGNDPVSVDAALERLALDPELRLRMGRESAKIARVWGRTERNDAVHRALSHALAGGG